MATSPSRVPWAMTVGDVEDEEEEEKRQQTILRWKGPAAARVAAGRKIVGSKGWVESGWLMMVDPTRTILLVNGLVEWACRGGRGRRSRRGCASAPLGRRGWWW